MTIAVLLSGGNGTRIGGEIPKQYIKVNQRRIMDYSLSTLCKSEYIDYVVIVAAKEWQQTIYEEMVKTEEDKTIGFALPGDNRQMSIYNALVFIEEYFKDRLTDKDCVFIHDAARPNLTEDMIREYIDAIEDHDGVMPVLPVKDTMYMSGDGDKVSELLDRKKLFFGQAPEVFKFFKYFEANKALLPDKILEINGSTEPAVLFGMDVIMVKGSEKNFKITTQADLDAFVASAV